MPPVFSFTEPVNLEGYNLLLTSVSVGNVPQLTADLFITSYKLKKIATIWHPAIIPCISGDPYFNDDSVISTSCELFANKDLKIAVMQLRSGLEQRHALSFFNDLKSEYEKMKLRNIIILTSVFHYELHNVQSNVYFYISDDHVFPKDISHIQKLKKGATGTYFLNGGGFALKLYEVFNNKSCFIVGKYVSEGDNRPDAHELMQKILPLIGIQESKFEVICPSSWQYVFGGPAPTGIF